MTRRIQLHPIPKELADKIPRTRLQNIPAINHLQECSEIYRLIHHPEFISSCLTHRHGVAISALNMDWYGFPNDLLTLLLQRVTLGTESFVTTACVIEFAQRGILPENVEYIKNPMKLSRGTADSHYNRLPGIADPSYSLKVCDKGLWLKVEKFYKETRNKILHGYCLTSNDPGEIKPELEMFREVFLWIDSWFEDKMGGLMPIQIRRFWPNVDSSNGITLRSE